MKKFSIPCIFNGMKSPFTIYIGAPEDSHHPLHFQADWLSRERGGTIPSEIMESIAKLKELADKNNVSFEDLCVYALGTAAQDGSEQEEAYEKANQESEEDNENESDNELEEEDNYSDESDEEAENEYNDNEDDEVINEEEQEDDEEYEIDEDEDEDEMRKKYNQLSWKDKIRTNRGEFVEKEKNKKNV